MKDNNQTEWSKDRAEVWIALVPQLNGKFKTISKEIARLCWFMLDMGLEQSLAIAKAVAADYGNLMKQSEVLAGLKLKQDKDANLDITPVMERAKNVGKLTDALRIFGYLTALDDARRKVNKAWNNTGSVGISVALSESLEAWANGLEPVKVTVKQEQEKPVPVPAK